MHGLGGRLGTQREGAPERGELDLAALGQAVWAKRYWIAVPTAMALVGSLISVNLTTPTYRSEARILVESGENPYTRAEGDRNGGGERAAVDQEAVLSQVQVVMSRDIERSVSGELELGKRPEFDPVLRGFNPVKQALILVGLMENPLRMTAEERVMRSYFEKLTAYQVDKSRVIAVQFESHDPALAADAANAVADGFIEAQQANKRQQTRSATRWLSGEIDGLRRQVEEAEGRVESFRARANLFVGTNNTSLTAQQLAEVNSQIAAARAQQADAQTRARLLRDFLRAGRPVESGDVVNSDIMRRLNEQRAAVQVQLAEQSSTLGPRHPRMAELRAQLSSLDQQVRVEAEKLVRVLENDARLAGARVETLGQTLDQVKQQASQASEQEVQLRVLEREAKALRDQLETLLARYRDASARDSLTAMPADARIVSRATVSNVPAFPKKLPTMLIAALGTLLLAIGCVATGALMNGTAQRPARSGGGTPPGSGEAIPDTPEREAEAAEPSEQPTEAPAAQDRVAAQASDDKAFEADLAEDLESEPQEETFAEAGDEEPVESVSRLAARLDAAGQPTRRTLILASEASLAATGVTLALGRQFAAMGRRVVMVDLDEDNRALSAIAGGGAAGLAELLAGQASFTEIIHRDPNSRAHLVPLGWIDPASAGVIEDDRLTFALNALTRTYDVVLVLAGRLAAGSEAFGRLAGFATDAVVIGGASAADPAVVSAYAALDQEGVKPVTVMLAVPEAAAAA
jgi:polysaccharide biosynthesis transport protein